MATSPVNFWRSLWLLARLRQKLTLRAYLRNSATLLGVALALAIFGPAAWAVGEDAHLQLVQLPPSQWEPYLVRLLNLVQGVLLLLLLPGSILALGQSLPAQILRPFPVRSPLILLAALLGALADIPLLLLLLAGRGMLLGAGHSGTGHSGTGTAVVLLTALTLLLLQTAALAQLLEQLGALLSRQRRLAGGFAVLGLLGGMAAGLPLTMTGLLPSGLAASGITAAARGAWGISLLFLLGLVAYAGLTFVAATYALEKATLREERAPEHAPRVLTRRGVSTGALSRFPVVEQILALTLTELRCLIRNPGMHLPLRQPATLLLALGYAWIAPDLGADYLRSAGDLLAMGGLFYALLWQIQLLCNRLGNEAGTAALLLGFPVPRWRLLLGRNLALLLLLLVADSVLILALCGASGRWHWLGPALLWLPAVLLSGTASGNLLSVLTPFAIPRSSRGFQPEPERALVFLYGLWIAGVVWSVWLLYQAFQKGALPGLLTLAAGGGLYLLSLFLSARLLAQNEQRLIRLLDR